MKFFRRLPRQGWLFFGLIALMFTLPMAAEHAGFHLGFRLLTLVVMLLGVYATSAHRHDMFLGLMLGIPMVVLTFVVHEWHTVGLALPGFLLGAAFFFHVGWSLLRGLLRERVVTAATLYSAVIVYMLAAVFFAALYGLTEFLDPKAFEGPLHSHPPLPMDFADALYFSMCTLTTVGFGDITPLGKFPRLLVGLESLFGVMYPTILIARLVGLFDLQSALREGDEEPPN